MREEVTLNLDLPPEQVIDDIVTQHLAALFFTKNTDWASEHEYRFTVETPDEEWTYLSVAGTLRDIVMGPDVSEADSLALWRQVQRLRGVGDDVHLTALNWWNGYPLVERLAID